MVSQCSRYITRARCEPSLRADSYNPGHNGEVKPVDGRFEVVCGCVIQRRTSRSTWWTARLVLRNRRRWRHVELWTRSTSSSSASRCHTTAKYFRSVTSFRVARHCFCTVYTLRPSVCPSLRYTGVARRLTVVTASFSCSHTERVGRI